MHGLQQQILRTDAAGMPLEWIDYPQAVRLYSSGQVLYDCGSSLYRIRGGWNARTGLRSIVLVSSIIATQGAHKKSFVDYIPPLNNFALFRRDAYLCLYCGENFLSKDLSRDHVTPLSQKGLDQWANVVTSCKRCNHHKAGRTPEQAGMQLLAIPFLPTHAEYMYLQGRQILADQMEFLQAHFPRSSPLRARLHHH